MSIQTSDRRPFLLILLLLGLCLSALPCFSMTDTATSTGPTFIKGRIANSIEIKWTCPENHWQTISLFYDTNNKAGDGKLIVQAIPLKKSPGSFFWNTAGVSQGSYYIYALFKDGAGTEKMEYAASPVFISDPRSCFDLSGRPNLLINPGFEQGNTTPSAWHIYTPGSRSDRTWGYVWGNDPVMAHEGKRAIKISNVYNSFNPDNSWEDRVIVNSAGDIEHTRNARYVLSAWIKTRNVNSGHVLFKIKYYDANGEKLKIQGHASDTFYTGGPSFSDWTRVHFLVNPPHWPSPPYPQTATPDSLSINFSLDNSPGSLWVDNVSLIRITDTEFKRLLPGNRYAPPPIVTSPEKRILKVKDDWAAEVKKDPDTGVWWMVGKDQKPFWALGSNVGINNKLKDATRLSTSAYVKKSQYRAPKELNFNQEWRYKTGVNKYSGIQNYIHWLNFSSEADIETDPGKWVVKGRNGNLIAGYGHYFPDVFSPFWQQNAINEAQKLLDDGGWLLESRQTIGYWTDNEWAYGDLSDFFWGDTMKLAFADWLQGKNTLPSVDAVFSRAGSPINLVVPKGFEIAHPYHTPADLNKAWTSDYHKYQYRSFSDIYGLDKPYIRAHNDPVKKDFHNFERVIFKIYVDTVIDNIRRVENNFISRTGYGFHHPIFSNRFGAGRPAAMEALYRNMDIFSRFDVISINLYPHYNQSGLYYPKQWLEIIKKSFHDTTGKPLYIAEFGIAAEDADTFDAEPGLFVARWRTHTVSHQYQRGWAYKNIIATLANLPWVIGANWFKWSNGYGYKGTDPRNCGMVDDQDNLYTHFTDSVRSVNKQIASIDRSGTFTLNNIDWGRVNPEFCNSVKP